MTIGLDNQFVVFLRVAGFTVVTIDSISYYCDSLVYCYIPENLRFTVNVLIFQTLLILFSYKRLVIRTGNQKMLVIIANREEIELLKCCHVTFGFVCLIVALGPKSTAIVMSGGSVHLTNFFHGQA